MKKSKCFNENKIKLKKKRKKKSKILAHPSLKKISQIFSSFQL